MKIPCKNNNFIDDFNEKKEQENQRIQHNFIGFEPNFYQFNFSFLILLYKPIKKWLT